MRFFGEMTAMGGTYLLSMGLTLAIGGSWFFLLILKALLRSGKEGVNNGIHIMLIWKRLQGLLQLLLQLLLLIDDVIAHTGRYFFQKNRLTLMIFSELHFVGMILISLLICMRIDRSRLKLDLDLSDSDTFLPPISSSGKIMKAVSLTCQSFVK